MLPSEKAKYLVEKFISLGIDKETAKECAKISMKEVEIELEDYAGNPVGSAYCNRVINKIEKL